MSDNPKTGVRISDVAKPGKSAPSSTSKAVLISNRPIIKDPMTVDGDQPSGGNIDDKPALTPNHITIARPGDNTSAKTESKKDPTISELAEAAGKAKAKVVTEPSRTKIEPLSDVASKSESTEATTKSDSKDEAEPANSTDSVDKADPVDEPSEGGSLTTDEDAAPEPTDPKAAADAAAIDEKRVAELDQLAASRKYYLPINQVEKRRAKHYTWAGIFLILILVIAWGDISLDAGIITVPGVKPLTHFFSK